MWPIKKTGLDIKYCLVGPAPKKISSIFHLPPIPTAPKKKLHSKPMEKKRSRAERHNFRPNASVGGGGGGDR
jgi:hypothetical protein